MNRINNYGLLRLSLALLVTLSHSYVLAHGSDNADPFYRYTRGQIGLGGFAVNGFFLLSGYLVTQSWLRNGHVGDFARKRVARMYPAFLVAVVFSAVLAAATSDSPIAYGKHLVYANADAVAGLLFPDGSALSSQGTFRSNPFPNAVNGSLWTLRWELICYALLVATGASGLLSSRFGVPALLGVCFAGLALNALVLNSPNVPLWRFTTCFLIGTAFARYPRLPRGPGWGVAAGVLYVGLGPYAPALHLAGPFLQAVTLFAIAHTRPAVAPSWFARNDYSYGIYLYSFPVQQLVVQQAPASHPLTVFAVTLPPVFALAYASWWLIESPALRAAKSP